MSASEADVKAAKELWEKPYGNDRLEGNLPRSFPAAFAAHRLAAEAATREKIAAELDDEAKRLRKGAAEIRGQDEDILLHTSTRLSRDADCLEKRAARIRNNPLADRIEGGK